MLFKGVDSVGREQLGVGKGLVAILSVKPIGVVDDQRLIGVGEAAKARGIAGQFQQFVLECPEHVAF